MRDKIIGATAAFMCEPGQECYPFSEGNFTEAMQNLSERQYAALAGLTEVVYQGTDPSAKSMLADFVMLAVGHYWADVSVYLAEKRMPCSAELAADREEYYND